MTGTITVKPGETLTVVGVPADSPLPPYIWGPGDPRPTNPIAGPGRGPNWGMANDPGYGIEVGSPPGIWGPGDPRPTNPIAGFDPIHGNWPDKPPPVQPPAQDEGNWVWAWSPQAGRWVWVKVPGEGEAGPK
jgi:hypothetical protein